MARRPADRRGTANLRLAARAAVLAGVAAALPRLLGSPARLPQGAFAVCGGRPQSAAGPDRRCTRRDEVLPRRAAADADAGLADPVALPPGPRSEEEEEEELEVPKLRGLSDLLGPSSGDSGAAPSADRQPAVKPAATKAETDGGALVAEEQLAKGQRVSGKVTKIIRSGFFVDIGRERDGFVHVSKASDGRVDSLDDWVEKGEELDMWVHKVKTDGRVELSCRPPVDLSRFKGLPKDEWLTGVVTGFDRGGIFVSVTPPGGGEVQQGKVRKQDIKEGKVVNPTQEADLGQEVLVRVKKVNLQRGRLDLSMRPWEP